TGDLFAGETHFAVRRTDLELARRGVVRDRRGGYDRTVDKLHEGPLRETRRRLAAVPAADAEPVEDQIAALVFETQSGSCLGGIARIAQISQQVAFRRIDDAAPQILVEEHRQAKSPRAFLPVL